MKGLSFIFTLLFLFTASSPVWPRYDDVEVTASDDTDNTDKYEQTDKPKRLFRPKFNGSFLGWQENAGVRGQIWRFMKHPQGLEIDLGFSRSSFANIFFDNPTNTDAAQSLQDLRVADNMWGPKIGFRLGKAYLDIHFSPYWGNTNALYIEATSGVWMWGDREGDNPVYIKSGIFFYGSFLSFKDPVFNLFNISSYENQELSKINSGWGYVHLGLGMPVIIGVRIGNIPLGDTLRLHRIDINLGVYARAGVLLPTHPSLSFGVLGPNLDIFFREEFGLYLNLHSYKTGYNTTQLDFGVRFKF